MNDPEPKRSLLEELKRRNVFRAAALYAGVGWLVIEVASTVLPTFHAPEWILQVLTFVVILGFPLALVLAWAFELTPEGLKRDSEVDRSATGATRARRGFSVAIVSVLAVALLLFALDRFAGDGSREMPQRAGAQERSVAVLPFENMSRDESNEPFTVGIHDDLLIHISRIRSIKTISRTSVLQYRGTTKTVPEIARELGVATILEGGVQKAGDRVRINVQLIDAATDEHLWSETYDRELTAANIFSIQSEIATSIAKSLQATLLPAEARRLGEAPTQSLAAVETYFLGKQLLERRTRESLFAAVEYFQEVIELDPDFALGHSGLADATMLLPEYVIDMDPRRTREQSEASAKRALELDPDLPEALTSMGWNRLIHYYDWEEAESLLRRALEVQSNNTNALHWLSHVLSWQGRHDEAFALARRAVEVDPHSGLMAMNMSYMHMDAGSLDAAIELARQTLRRHPDLTELVGNLWLTYLRAGRPDRASETIARWARLTGRDSEAAREVGDAFLRYHETGRPQTLPSALVDRAEFGLEDLGQVYAFVGDAGRTLEALEQAFEERAGSRSVLSMKVNPGYDFIRTDPRFVDLMKRVGLEN
jgi:serine/threonine-protein kinase